MKKRILILFLIVCLTFGISYAADLNETLSEDTKQWLRDNQHKWWAKEVVLYLDQRQDIIDLNFGNFITDTVNYFKNYDDYVNYKLKGNESPVISPFELISYTYDSSSVDKGYWNRLLCGYDSSGKDLAFFGSYEPDSVGKQVLRIDSKTSGQYISLRGSGDFNNSGGTYRLIYTNKHKGGGIYNGKDYKYTYCYFPGGELKSTLVYKCNKTFTATVTITNGIKVTGLPAGNVFQEGNTYNIIITYDNSYFGDVKPSSLYDSEMTVGSFSISSVPPAPDKPSFNTTYAPNINTFLDTNNNWVNNYAENQYYNISNIYNSIINDVNENNKYIDNVVDIIDTPNRPIDPSTLFNYPSDFLNQLKNVLTTGYSSNFKFHMNEVVFKDHIILPNIDIELNPRDLFGDFWTIFTYIIVFILTIPWIIWFIRKVRGESDIS